MAPGEGQGQPGRFLSEGQAAEPSGGGGGIPPASHEVGAGSEPPAPALELLAVALPEAVDVELDAPPVPVAPPPPADEALLAVEPPPLPPEPGEEPEDAAPDPLLACPPHWMAKAMKSTAPSPERAATRRLRRETDDMKVQRRGQLQVTGLTSYVTGPEGGPVTVTR